MVVQSKEQLVAILRDLAELLARHNEKHWADWIFRDVEYLKRDDAYGIEHFL